MGTQRVWNGINPRSPWSGGTGPGGESVRKEPLLTLHAMGGPQRKLLRGQGFQGRGTCDHRGGRLTMRRLEAGQHEGAGTEACEGRRTDGAISTDRILLNSSSAHTHAHPVTSILSRDEDGTLNCLGRRSRVRLLVKDSGMDKSGKMGMGTTRRTVCKCALQTQKLGGGAGSETTEQEGQEGILKGWGWT